MSLFVVLSVKPFFNYNVTFPDCVGVFVCGRIVLQGMKVCPKGVEWTLDTLVLLSLFFVFYCTCD